MVPTPPHARADAEARPADGASQRRGDLRVEDGDAGERRADARGRFGVQRGISCEIRGGERGVGVCGRCGAV